MSNDTNNLPPLPVGTKLYTHAQQHSTAGGGEAVAWQYELATSRAPDGTYSFWRWQITSSKPSVPEGSVRNLRPLVYGDAPSPQAEPVSPTSADELHREIGRQMVAMTTTVRCPEEWLAIPELWRRCMVERDEAQAKLAALAHPAAPAQPVAEAEGVWIEMHTFIEADMGLHGEVAKQLARALAVTSSELRKVRATHPAPAAPAPSSKPCHSPYCECSAGQCTQPGFHDARGSAPVTPTWGASAPKPDGFRSEWQRRAAAAPAQPLPEPPGAFMTDSDIEQLVNEYDPHLLGRDGPSMGDMVAVVRKALAATSNPKDPT